MMIVLQSDDSNQATGFISNYRVVPYSSAELLQSSSTNEESSRSSAIIMLVLISSACAVCAVIAIILSVIVGQRVYKRHVAARTAPTIFVQPPKSLSVVAIDSSKEHQAAIPTVSTMRIPLPDGCNTCDSEREDSE
jgi:hypothetical protein